LHAIEFNERSSVTKRRCAALLQCRKASPYRLIAAMAAEGKTQGQIATALDIDHKTVSKVVKELGKNDSAIKAPQPPAIPDLFAAEPSEDEDDGEPEPLPPPGGN
jgi:hypothetical protein